MTRRADAEGSRAVGIGTALMWILVGALLIGGFVALVGLAARECRKAWSRRRP
jgi:hypothetical protein